jgi:GNAT superfamily N-acetyltransferase
MDYHFVTTTSHKVSVRAAVESDLPLILHLIESLADYEKLRDQCVATEQQLQATLFGAHPAAEVLIASIDSVPMGFALFFHNYSTFLAQPGIFLEDLFVKPDARGKGVGHALLSSLAQLAVERNCGRLEWSVLDWNELAISFYKRIGAVPMDEWTTFRLAGEALEGLASSRTDSVS